MNRNPIKTNIQRRRHDATFQKGAVDMILQDGKSIVDVARDLGINKHTLRNWKVKALQKIGTVEINGQVRSAIELDTENRQLRKELESIKRQRDILKKAMSILGEEPTGGMR